MNALGRGWDKLNRSSREQWQGLVDDDNLGNDIYIHLHPQEQGNMITHNDKVNLI